MLQSPAIRSSQNKSERMQSPTDNLKTIQINSDAPVEFLELASGQSIVIIDDFLSAPDELRQFAKAHADEFSMPPKSYPGIVRNINSRPLTDIYRFVRSTLGNHFSFFRGGAEFSTFLSMTTLQPDELSNLQRLCHSDPTVAGKRRNFAFVLYLFENEELGGTGFYRWKEQEAVTEATAIENEDPAKAIDYIT
jgi:hypothetical protein